MFKYLVSISMLFILSGCTAGKNLSVEQLQAIGELSKIQNVSGCTLGVLEGSSPMVGGGGKIVICWGTEKPLTVNEINQLTEGYVITLQAK